jgi:hypothetical protein
MVENGAHSQFAFILIENGSGKEPSSETGMAS